MEGVAPPFAAVLFDLDGVLRNTEPYHRMAYAQLARSLSGGAPPDAGEIAGHSLWGGVLLLALVRGALPAGVGDV